MTSTRTRHDRPRRRDRSPDDPIAVLRDWCESRGWRAFPFQEEVWRACSAGESGLLHAPTGTGKTLAAWLGAIARSRESSGPGVRVVWITPLRALAADTVQSLEHPLADLRGWLGRGWRVASRTGDSSAADRRRLRENWPEALVTTPESLSILLSLEDAHEIFAGLDTVVEIGRAHV